MNFEMHEILDFSGEPEKLEVKKQVFTLKIFFKENRCFWSKILTIFRNQHRTKLTTEKEGE